MSKFIWMRHAFIFIFNVFEKRLLNTLNPLWLSVNLKPEFDMIIAILKIILLKTEFLTEAFFP